MNFYLTLLILTTSLTLAQTWNQVISAKVAAPYVLARKGHRMAPHLGGNGFFMWGGFLQDDFTVGSTSTQYDPTLWYFNVTQSKWSPWVADGQGSFVPAARENFVWIVNEADGIAFMHGGEDYGFVYADSWQLDLYTGKWTLLQKADANAPSQVYFDCSFNVSGNPYVEYHDKEAYNDFATAYANDPNTLIPDALKTNISYIWSAPLDTLNANPNNTGITASDETVDGVAQIKLNFGPRANVFVPKTCSRLVYDAPVTPELTLHQGSYDPTTDAYFLHGGEDKNNVYQNDVYKVTVVKSGNVRTIICDKLTLTGGPYIHSHVFSAITAPNATFSTLVSFSGSWDRRVTDPAKPLTQAVWYLHLNGSSTWTGPIYIPYYYKNTLVTGRVGCSGVYSARRNQLMITNGIDASKVLQETLFLTFPSADASTWYWRDGSATKFAAFYTALVKVGKNGYSDFSATTVYRFGGQNNLQTGFVISSMESVSFESLTSSSLLGTDTRPPAPIPPPTTTDGSYRVSVMPIVVGGSTIMSSVHIPVATAVATTSISGTTETTSAGLSGPLASLVYAGLGLIGALVVLAIVLNVMQKKSRARRGVRPSRPSKSNFYAL